MNYKIRILETALEEIEIINNFIFTNTRSREISNKIIFELFARINSLNFMPE